MNKTAIRITPVSGYDLPGLELWLAKLAARGLRFSMTAGPLTIFQRGEPRQVAIHLECAKTKTDQEDEELSALYQEAGWSYWGIFRKNFYVFAAPAEHTIPPHTHPDVLLYAIRKFLRQKLLGGAGLAIINFLLLLYLFPGAYQLEQLRYSPAEYLGYALPFFLCLGGLAFADLAYLHGLGALFRLIRRVRTGEPLTPAPGSRLAGAAVVLSVLLLGTVLLNYFTQIGAYMNPWLPLEGSGFVTLRDIEGPSLPLTPDTTYSMTCISHSDSLLTPETWFFQQYGSFAHYEGGAVNINTAPHLELSVARYHFPALARQRVVEWSYFGGPEEYQVLEPAYGLDQILLLQREGGAFLILRMDATVLRADYRGSKDLSGYLERFAHMMEGL